MGFSTSVPTQEKGKAVLALVRPLRERKVEACLFGHYAGEKEKKRIFADQFASTTSTGKKKESVLAWMVYPKKRGEKERQCRKGSSLLPWKEKNTEFEGGMRALPTQRGRGEKRWSEPGGAEVSVSRVGCGWEKLKEKGG